MGLGPQIDAAAHAAAPKCQDSASCAVKLDGIVRANLLRGLRQMLLTQRSMLKTFASTGGAARFNRQRVSTRIKAIDRFPKRLRTRTLAIGRRIATRLPNLTGQLLNRVDPALAADVRAALKAAQSGDPAAISELFSGFGVFGSAAPSP